MTSGSPEPQSTPTPSAEIPEPEPAPDLTVDAADLYSDCTNGDMYSCDTLYWISPVGSDDEAYGATCGGLFFDWQYGTCSEL
jgi:hypothetical protein